MTKITRYTVLVLTSAGFLFTGCGSSSAPEENAATAANTYLQALGSRKYKKACDMLTPDSRRGLFAETMTMGYDAAMDAKLVKIAKRDGGANLQVEIDGCAETIEASFKSLSEEDRKQLIGFRFDSKDIKIHGTTATVPKINDVSTTHLLLIEGKWLVDLDR